MKKIILLFLFFFFLSPNRVLAIDPQYIFVRKNPFNCNPANCSQLWDFSNPRLDYYSGIIDVYNKVGTHGNDQRKLGIGLMIWYNLYNFESVRQSLVNVLESAKVNTAPLFISLDGFQFWDQRPNLWYWWDPTISSEERDRRKANVEWTCNSPSCAIDKSWRNWGSEFEVKPQPNIASRAVIEDTKERLRILVPIIVNWYNGLPDDKKWLLGGIDLGTEVDIGGNYFQKNAQTGFAAVNTLGLSGGVTSDNIDEAIRRYVDELDHLAFDLGIPRNKIFNHAHPWHIQSALTDFGNPAWTQWAGPEGFDSVINQINNSEWSAPEWYTSTTTGDQNGYASALRGTLNHRNNRFLNISNWEEIRDQQYILNALRTVLNENPSCWVTSPVLNSPSINGRNVTLSWQNGENNVATYLNASTVGDFNPSGTLKNMNVINAGVTGRTTYNLSSLSPGKYYWAVVADGCSPVQRRIANGQFEIGTPPTLTPTPLPVPGDLNHDSKVNIFDYNTLLQNFGSTACGNTADIDGNCKVDIFDYNILVQNFDESQ